MNLNNVKRRYLSIQEKSCTHKSSYSKVPL